MPGVVGHAFNHSTWEIEAIGRHTLPQKNKNKRKDHEQV